MDWKNILKAPLPNNARANRDAEYKKKIIEFERQNIQTHFESFVGSGESAGYALRLIVKVDPSKTNNGLGQVYTIGRDGLLDLGGNPEFILNEISRIYREEGYNVGNIKTSGTGIFQIEILQQ